MAFPVKKPGAMPLPAAPKKKAAAPKKPKPMSQQIADKMLGGGY